MEKGFITKENFCKAIDNMKALYEVDVRMYGAVVNIETKPAIPYVRNAKDVRVFSDEFCEAAFGWGIDFLLNLVEEAFGVTNDLIADYVFDCHSPYRSAEEIYDAVMNGAGEE